MFSITTHPNTARAPTAVTDDPVDWGFWLVSEEDEEAPDSPQEPPQAEATASNSSIPGPSVVPPSIPISNPVSTAISNTPSTTISNTASTTISNTPSNAISNTLSIAISNQQEGSTLTATMTDDTDDVVKGGQGTPTKNHPPSSSTKENILPPPSSTSNSPARRRIDRQDTIPPSTAVSRPPVPTTGFTFGKRSYSEFFEEISQNRDPVPDTAKTPLLHAPASLPTVDNTPIDPTPHPSSSTLLSPALEGHSPSANNVSRRHRTLRRKRAARSNAPASVSEDDPLTLRILFALEAVKPRFRVGSDLFDLDPDYATEIPCQWDLSTGGHSRHDIYTEKSGAYKHLKEQHSVGSAINGAVPVRVTCQWGDHCRRSIKLESLARHIESHVSGSVYCQLCREWRNERGQPARCIGHLRKQCSFTREGATTLEELHAKLVELDIITAEENLPVVPSSPVLPAQASSSTSQPGPSSIAGPSSIPSASTATSHFVAQTSGGGNKRRRVK